MKSCQYVSVMYMCNFSFSMSVSMYLCLYIWELILNLSVSIIMIFDFVKINFPTGIFWLMIIYTVSKYVGTTFNNHQFNRSSCFFVPEPDMNMCSCTFSGMWGWLGYCTSAACGIYAIMNRFESSVWVRMVMLNQPQRKSGPNHKLSSIIIYFFIEKHMTVRRHANIHNNTKRD